MAAVDLELIDLEAVPRLYLNREGVLEEADLDTPILIQELAHNSILVQAALNFILDRAVLNPLVFLNNLLDLGHNALESPLSEIGCHLHILALSFKLHLLYLLEEVSEFFLNNLALQKSVKHFL